MIPGGLAVLESACRLQDRALPEVNSANASAVFQRCRCGLMRVDVNNTDAECRCGADMGSSSKWTGD